MNTRMFTVTREWIHGHKTPRGAWKRAQLEIIGVKWPPKQGWINRVSGKQISEEDRIRFELGAADKQTNLVELIMGGRSPSPWN